MNIIKPKSLKIGDTLAIVAPAGNIDKDTFLKGIMQLKNLGFKTIYSEKIFEQNKYLAGKDIDKISELEAYFKDKSVDGILCARGGYGSIRLINSINYEIIKNNPKFFGGYSDITALQLMIFKKTGLITYSAPMICSDFGNTPPSEFTINSFLSTTTTNNPIQINGKLLISGTSTGYLWGGNLSTIVSLCGQDFIPDEKFIFFAEDLNESVYKIDKMLTQLINIPKFRNNIVGIVFGEFSNPDNQEWLEELLLEKAQILNIPTIQIPQITHSKNKLTIPIGAIATISNDKLSI